MAERQYNMRLSATDGFSGAFNKLLGEMNSAEAASARLRNAFTGLAGAFGVSLSFSALKDLIGGTIDAAARLDDLSEKTGASVESLSKFAGVARITGQDLGSVESAMSKLSKALVEAQDGGSNAARAFAAFGINIRDAAGKLKNSGEVMDELARKQQGFEDGAGKAAATMELLGKSGAEVIPFLNDYVRLSDQIAVTTADQAKQAEDFNIQLGLMKENFSALLRDALLPTLGKFNELLRTSAKLREEYRLFSGFNPFEALGNYLQKAIEKQVWWATYLQTTFDNIRKLADWTPGSGITKTVSASAAADLAVLTLRNKQLADATREIPPLMESTAQATAKAGVAYAAAGKSTKALREETEILGELMRRFDPPVGKFNELKDITAETVNAINAERSSLIKQADTLGMTTLELIDYQIAQLQARMASEQLAVDVDKVNSALVDQITALERLRDKTLSNDRLRAEQDSAKRAADEWKRAADQIGDSLTDALLRGFESGKDFGKNFADTLSNLFRTLILKPIIQFIVAPVGNAIQAALGGFLPSASGAASGILGGGGNLFGGPGGGLAGIGNWIAGLGGGGGGFLGGFGGGLANLGVEGLLGGMGMNFSGGFAALGAGNILGGLGSLAAGALPVIGIGLAIASALGAFERGGPKVGGSASSTADLGLGSVSAGGIGRLFTPDQKDSALQAITDQVATDYLNIARSLGLTAGGASFGLGFHSDPEGDAGSQISAQALVGGRAVYNVADLDVDEGDINSALELNAKRALLAALQATEMPSYLSQMFAELDTASATAAQIDELVQTAAALRIAVDAISGLGPQFAAMDPADVRAFVESFGGLEAMMQRVAYLGENFYTDAEKLAKATDALTKGFADLGIAVPDTHAAFMALLDSLDLTTEEGRAMYEAISALAPVFVQVRGTAQQAADALEPVVDVLDEIAEVAGTIDVGSIARSVGSEFDRIMNMIGGLVGEMGGTLGDALTTQMRLVDVEIGRLMSQLGSVAPGSAESQALLELIEKLQAANAGAAAELARFTILAAQYDSERAGALVELERWYKAQQALFVGNAEALAALAKIFDERWQDIIEGIGGGVDGTLEELERIKASLRDYLKSIALRSDISPLSPAAKLAAAQKDYLDLLQKAQGGDIDALRDLQGAADAYLRIARDMFASSGQFTTIWQSVVDALGALSEPPRTGGIEPQQVVADAMPQGSPVASQADIADLKDEVSALLRAIAAGTRDAASAPVVDAVRNTAAAGAPRK